MYYNIDTIKKGDNNMSKEDYQFILTREQQETICTHFGVDINEVEDWQIAELLDKVIDDLIPIN